MIKVILDTNIFLSAFLYQRMTKRIFDLILDEKLDLYVSEDLKQEIIRKCKEYHVNQDVIEETAQADYLITRDKDLLELPLQQRKSTKIVKPEDFLPLLRKMGML